MLSLGNRIKASRLRAGFTQEDVAEAVGVSRTAVTRWESGEIEPQLQNLVAVARLLSVSTDYLLGMSDKASGFAGLTPKAEQMLADFILELRSEVSKNKNGGR